MLSRNGSDGDALETGQQAGCLQIQGTERGLFHFIKSVKLFNHQLGIGADDNTASAQSGGLFQSGNKGPVFSLVVGGTSDGLRDRSEEVATLILNGGADSRRAGIAPRRPIRINNQPFCIQITLYSFLRYIMVFHCLCPLVDKISSPFLKGGAE